jgi:hypothetical protein
MASKTEIGNRMLTKIGQPRVSNFETDNSSAAMAVNVIYEAVLKSTLQMYPWNFAIKRAPLAPDVTAPAWGFLSAFPVPSDCLQLLEIKDDVEYQIEGGKILCDEGNVIYIKYISYVTDASLYPPIFVELFAQNGAIEICSRVTDDEGMKQNLLLQMRDLRDKVLATDAVENWPEMLVEDDWIRARF